MRERVIWLLSSLGGFALATSALAQPLRPSNLSLCQKLKQTTSEQRLELEREALKDAFRIVFNPNYYAKPRATTISTPVTSRPNSAPAGRSVIFSLDTPGNPQLKELDELNEKLAAMERTIRRLSVSLSISDCLKLARQSSFSYSEYLLLLAEREKLAATMRHREHQFVETQLRRARRDLKQNWELSSVTTLSQVFHAVRSSEISDVVIVSHSLSTGQLVSSLQAGYPKGLFEDMAAGLRSISVFSCHSEAVVEFFSLKQRMAQTPSYLGKRMLFTVQSRGLQGRTEADSTPLFAFSNFIKTVDKALAEIPDTARAEIAANMPDDCKASLRGISPIVGEYGIYLNLKLVGVLSPGATAKLEFPCNVIDPVTNELVIRTLQLDRRSDASVSEIVAIETVDGRHFRGTPSLARRDDDSLEALLVPLNPEPEGR